MSSGISRATGPAIVTAEVAASLLNLPRARCRPLTGTMRLSLRRAETGVWLSCWSNTFSGGKGVVVTAIDPDGLAAEQGFKTGDVILDIGGKAVASAADVHRALAEAKNHGKRDALMRVKTGDAVKFVAVPLERG